MEYTGKTEIPFGKYKGRALTRVPARYLLWYYKQEGAVTWPALYQYCKKNYTVVAHKAAEEEEMIRICREEASETYYYD